MIDKYGGSTVWKLLKFTLTKSLQKIREDEAFAVFITLYTDSRKRDWSTSKELGQPGIKIFLLQLQ